MRLRMRQIIVLVMAAVVSVSGSPHAGQVEAPASQPMPSKSSLEEIFRKMQERQSDSGSSTSGTALPTFPSRDTGSSSGIHMSASSSSSSSGESAVLPMESSSSGESALLPEDGARLPPVMPTDPRITQDAAEDNMDDMARKSGIINPAPVEPSSEENLGDGVTPIVPPARDEEQYIRPYPPQDNPAVFYEQ